MNARRLTVGAIGAVALALALVTSQPTALVEVCFTNRAPRVQELVIETGLADWYQTVGQLGALYHTWGDWSPPANQIDRWVFKYDSRYAPAPEALRALAQQHPGGIWVLGEEPNFLDADGQPQVANYVAWYHDYSRAVLNGDPTAYLVWGYLAQPWGGVTFDSVEYTKAFLSEWKLHADWCPAPPLNAVHVNFFPELEAATTGYTGRAALDVGRVTRYLARWTEYLDSEPRLAGVGLSLGTGFSCAFEDTGDRLHPVQDEIIAWMGRLVAAVKREPRVSLLMNFPGYYAAAHGCPAGTPWASSVQRGGQITRYGLALGQAWRGYARAYAPILLY